MTELREWFRCSACGDGVRVDEDGCCVTCGRDTTIRGGRREAGPTVSCLRRPRGAAMVSGAVPTRMQGPGPPGTDEEAGKPEEPKEGDQMTGVFCADSSGRRGLTLRMEHGRLVARATAEGFILSGGLSRAHELTGVLTGLDDIPR